MTKQFLTFIVMMGLAPLAWAENIVFLQPRVSSMSRSLPTTPTSRKADCRSVTVRPDNMAINSPSARRAMALPGKHGTVGERGTLYGLQRQRRWQRPGAEPKTTNLPVTYRLRHPQNENHKTPRPHQDHRPALDICGSRGVRGCQGRRSGGAEVRVPQQPCRASGLHRHCRRPSQVTGRAYGWLGGVPVPVRLLAQSADASSSAVAGGEIAGGGQDQPTAALQTRGPWLVKLASGCSSFRCGCPSFPLRGRQSTRARINAFVFDELHTYRGRQGADVALLIRRCRQAFGGHAMICIGTLATMASGSSTEDQKREVAKVANMLFGVPFDAKQVIGET